MDNSSASVSVAQAAITEEEAYEIGIEAFVYAYPMVLMEFTRRVRANAAEPDPRTRRTPMNRFAHASAYADANSRDVVRPNADTLYSSLWYDVGGEPLVFTLSETAGRYYVIPFMDMWTDVFATLGTRTTGSAGGTFALVGPRWNGTLPEGVRAIVSPTDVGYVIGRIQTNGVDDYAHVHALQAGLKAVPLSGWGNPSFVPAPGQVDPSIDMNTPPPAQVEQLEPGAFFAIFAEALKRNPPNATDYAILLRMERIGLVAGRGFDLAKAAPAVQRALTRVAPDAYRRIRSRGRGIGTSRHGWSSTSTPIGVYGNDYLLRAYVAYAGLGALPREEAIYPMAANDSDGHALTGDARYMLHFDQDQMPPVDAFWSLTMYGADQFFVDNPLNRYAIGDRDKLTFNADGSLDIYIQHASPGQDKESNWLPAPAGRYSMNLRLYLPKPEALDERWVPPALTRVFDVVI